MNSPISKPIIKKVFGSDPYEIDNRLKWIPSIDILYADSFVFKVGRSLLQQLQTDSQQRQIIRERAGYRPIFLVAYDREQRDFVLYELDESGLSERPNSSYLDAIRQCDLLEVIAKSESECIVDAPDHSHFVTPAGKHTKRFLRLSEALYSYGALDRISFWLQPVMSGMSGVVIDNWSLASIVLKTEQLLREEIPFDCFHEHVRVNKQKGIRVLNKLGRFVNPHGTMLYIVGVAASGTFHETLHEVINSSALPNQYQVISLYAFANTPDVVDRFATLPFNDESYDEDKCVYCSGKERPQIYHIDSRFYYPKKYQESAVKFTYTLLTENGRRSSASDFIHRYGGYQGVLRVHRDDPNDGRTPRHHTYYIDVVALLQISDFRQEVIAVMRSIAQTRGVPDMIVIPCHQAGDEISSLIRTEWVDAEILRRNDLFHLTHNEERSFSRAEHIVFADDVVVTRTRIDTYLRGIREGVDTEIRNSPLYVTWLPLIVRPRSQEEVRTMRDALSKHGSLNNELWFLYEVCLPAWTTRQDCPWCHEWEVWERDVDVPWDSSDWFDARIRKLSNVEEGICDRPLLTHPFSTSVSLGGNSAIAERGISEIQVLFLVANGLQVLRTRPESPLGKDDWIVRHVLFFDGSGATAPGYDTWERFSEALIRNAFLRSVKLTEWSVRVRREGARRLSNDVATSEYDGMIGEALLFIARGGARGRECASLTERAEHLVPEETVASLCRAVRGQ